MVTVIFRRVEKGRTQKKRRKLEKGKEEDNVPASYESEKGPALPYGHLSCERRIERRERERRKWER
jgi:hypothetical protein